MKSQPPQLSFQHNCFSKLNELHFIGQYRFFFFFGGGGGVLASKVNYKQRGSGVLTIESQQDSGSKFLPKRISQSNSNQHQSTHSQEQFKIFN